MKALVFDAYGTLFDVFSVTSLCEDLFPGHGKQLAQIWRTKQLEYSWLRSLMGRYRDFWALTQDARIVCKTSNMAPTRGWRPGFDSSSAHDLTTESQVWRLAEPV